MKYIKDLKNKTLLLIIAVIGLTLGVIGVSYSVFMQINSSADQVITTGNLNVVFAPGTTLTASMLPMTNASGLAQNGYKFSVTNSGTLLAKYNIKLKSGATNAVSHDQFFVSLCDGNGANCATPVLLSNIGKDPIDTNAYLIKSDVTIGLQETNNHTIKIWIKEDASETISGQIINLTMEIESVVNG